MYLFDGNVSIQSFQFRARKFFNCSQADYCVFITIMITQIVVMNLCAKVVTKLCCY